MIQATFTCSVRHRSGTDAQRLCPVHGAVQASANAVVPASMSAAFARGEKLPLREVEGYSPSHLVNTDEGPIWKNDEGQLHRLDGPAFSFKDYGNDYEFVNYEYRIDGRDVSAPQVYGRFMEAMSDGIVPSTDLGVLRDMLLGGALHIDERTKTITVASQARFDRLVDDFSSRARTLDKGAPRPVREATIDKDAEDEVTFFDGEWNRHRPFGKAIVTDDSEVVTWWWKGDGASMTKVIANSLHESSEGAISMDNARATEFVAANSELDRSGMLRLKAYPNHGWKELSEAILRKFPNPEPGENIRVVTYKDEPGAPSGAQWTRDGKAHRLDGAAISYESSSPVYAIDGKRATREALLLRMVADAGGDVVDESNAEAVRFIEDTAGVNYGSAEDDYAITVDGDLLTAANLALSVHHNL